MFEQTFVGGKTKTPLYTMMSFLFQCALVGMGILFPLIYTQTLPSTQLTSFLVAPPPPPPAAPPPAAVPMKAVRMIPRQFDAGRLMAPKTIPKDIAFIKEDELPPETAGVVGGMGSGLATGALAGILNSVAAAAPPPPVVKPTAIRRVEAKVGGNVKPPRSLNKPQPVYPPIARTARVQGTVRFTAIIGVDGKIQDLKLVSAASPLLVQAATDAVRQWTYEPLLLNGEPVEVVMQIDVNFYLNQ